MAAHVGELCRHCSTHPLQGSPSPESVFLKIWLISCFLKCRFLNPLPDLLNRNVRESDTASCLFTCSPGDRNVCQSRRPSACRRKQTPPRAVAPDPGPPFCPDTPQTSPPSPEECPEAVRTSQLSQAAKVSTPSAGKLPPEPPTGTWRPVL